MKCLVVKHVRLAFQGKPTADDPNNVISHPAYLSGQFDFSTNEMDPEKVEKVLALIAQAQEGPKAAFADLEKQVRNCPEFLEMQRLRDRVEQARTEQANQLASVEGFRRAAVQAVAAGEDSGTHDKKAEAAYTKAGQAARVVSTCTPALRASEERFKAIQKTAYESARHKWIGEAADREQALLEQLRQTVVEFAGKIEAERQLRQELSRGSIIPLNPPLYPPPQSAD